MRNKKQNKLNNRGWGLDSLIELLVCFGIAIVVIVIVCFVNKIF